jgi:hypothetical protein
VALVVRGWLLWSLGFGLRPTGGLESIEKDLRGARTPTVEPLTASIDREGVADGSLPVDGTGVAGPEDASARVPADTPANPANPGGEALHEDTAPKPPAMAKPVVTPTDSSRQASNPASPAPAVTAPPPRNNPPAAASPKPVKRAKKPEPKKEPDTSPEDAAGPPR